MGVYIYIHTYMTWHDMTWHDMTWHDMTWHDMTWHDMTWHYITLHYITLHTYIYIILYIYIYYIYSGYSDITIDRFICMYSDIYINILIYIFFYWSFDHVKIIPSSHRNWRPGTSGTALGCPGVPWGALGCPGWRPAKPQAIALSLVICRISSESGSAKVLSVGMRVIHRKKCWDRVRICKNI